VVGVSNFESFGFVNYERGEGDTGVSLRILLGHRLLRFFGCPSRSPVQSQPLTSARFRIVNLQDLPQVFTVMGRRGEDGPDKGMSPPLVMGNDFTASQVHNAKSQVSISLIGFPKSQVGVLSVKWTSAVRTKTKTKIL